MRFLYGLRETFPSARMAMPVQCPLSLVFRVPGFCSGRKATALTPRLLAEVKGVRSCTSAAPCMLSWRGQLTQPCLFYLVTYIPGNVSTYPAIIIVAFTFVFVLYGCEM